jgi:hypothetical protein
MDETEQQTADDEQDRVGDQNGARDRCERQNRGEEQNNRFKLVEGGHRINLCRKQGRGQVKSGEWKIESGGEMKAAFCFPFTILRFWADALRLSMVNLRIDRDHSFSLVHLLSVIHKKSGTLGAVLSV